MTLDPEWQCRLDSWRSELARRIYRRLGAAAVDGFTTQEQLTLEEASLRRFAPMPSGLAWGAKWEYGWFRGEFALPDEAANERIVFRPDFGAESLVFIDGVAAGAKDKEHQEILLADSGETGRRYRFLAEAYAGHGPRVQHVGPVPEDFVSVGEPAPTQVVLGESTFGIWEEDAFQLWMDVETLFHARNNIDPESLRVAEIDRGLKDFTLIADLEATGEPMRESLRRARERLAPLLACVNGSTAPTMFCVGHAHIDAAYLWPLEETERKCGRTFSTQLAMEQYPEYKFLQSQPYLYWVAKTRYPELYARIAEAVKAGQWIAEGGMWIESDTNIPSGESLIRQFVHGKRFFREEFGIDNEVMWQPDVFGYSGQLPQILRGCGMNYFVTAKLFWTYKGGDLFPYTTFTWEGIDGSEVLVHLANEYNSQSDPESIVERWHQRRQKDGISTRLVPFGWGDGGGGPTRQHLEHLRRERDLEGIPKCRIESPVAFFKDLEERGYPDARYVGELYYTCHRGTYTTQARVKRGNRKCEAALREAEYWSAASLLTPGGYTPEYDLLDEAWKGVLLNQFHDIIPGSCIGRVAEEAEALHAKVLATANEIALRALRALTEGTEGGTEFNSLPWERNCLVPIGEDVARTLPAHAVQEIGGVKHAELNVPACGWAPVGPAIVNTPPSTQIVRANGGLENERIRVAFNALGEIESIWDKEAGREIVADPCNSLKMFRDVPTKYDAWDIDSIHTLAPFALTEPATIETIAEGPLVGRLRIARRLNHSSMTQFVSLRRGSRTIEFATEIDWQERHKLLKVAFPVDLHTTEAVHEIQFGHLSRPTHASLPHDADRFEVAHQKWSALCEEGRGCAVLNDCKYGIGAVKSTLNLTLLRSPLAPDGNADRGRQIFTYAFTTWNGRFADSGVVREAYELNHPPRSMTGTIEARSLFGVDAPNVILETVKPAEDRSSDLVLRLYEAQRMSTRCAVSLPASVKSAALTNMLEDVESELPVESGRITLEFRPFEVKTVRLRVGETD